MTDSEMMQDFFDAFEVVNRLNAIVTVDDFLAGRQGLLEYASKADSDPKHVLSCIKRIYKGIGPRLFKSFVTLENVAPAEGLDDVWQHWCPSPACLQRAAKRALHPPETRACDLPAPRTLTYQPQPCRRLWMR